MTTYNGAEYLEQQLNSFLSQTRRPDEVVVVDDGSTDGTVDILRIFSARAPFGVRIYENETNIGFVKNFERAISYTDGDILFLSDQDDVWFPNKIEVVLSVLSDNSKLLSVTNDQMITDSKLNPSGVTKMANLKNLGLPSNVMITGCCTAIRSEMKKMVLPIPDKCESHDGWIASVADLYDARVMLDDVLQYYRRHERNASQSQISRSGRLSKFDGLFRIDRQKIRSQLLVEISVARQLESRVRGELGAWGGEMFSDMTIRNARQLATGEVRKLERRQALRLQRHPFRIVFMLMALARGDYAGHYTWRNVLKDFLA